MYNSFPKVNVINNVNKTIPLFSNGNRTAMISKQKSKRKKKDNLNESKFNEYSSSF